MAMTMLTAAAPGPLDGTWSGDRLVVTIADGAATVATDCGGGRIAGPLRLDPAGTFSADGEFEDFAAGPDAGDRVAPPAHAHYAGRLDGSVLVLTITRPKQTRSFRVARGGRGIKLIRCA